MSKQAKKGFSIFQKVIMIILGIIIVLMGIVNLLFGKTTSAPSFGNNVVFINRETNMDPEIKQNTAVISEKDNVYTLQAGNVVLCQISTEKVAVLRIYEIQEDVLGNKIYCVRPDAGQNPQTLKLQQSNIIAKSTQTSDELGSLILFVVSGIGKIVLGAIPAVIIMLIVIVHSAFAKSSDDEEEYEDDDEYEDEYEDDEEDNEEEEKEMQRHFSKKIPSRQGISKPSETTAKSYSDKTILYNPQEVPLFTPQDIKDTDEFKEKKASISNNFGMNSTVGTAVAVAEKLETKTQITPYSEEDVQRTAEAKVAEIKMAIQKQAQEKQQALEINNSNINSSERQHNLYEAASDTSKSPYLEDNDVLMEQIMQGAKSSKQPTAIERITEKQEELKQVNSSIHAVPTIENTEAEQINQTEFVSEPIEQPVKRVVKKRVRKPATFEDIMKVLDEEEKKLK